MKLDTDASGEVVVRLERAQGQLGAAPADRAGLEELFLDLA